VARHEVFYWPDQPTPGSPLRIATDRDSFDIAGLSESEFNGLQAEFSPVTFMQPPRLLNSDYVDAGIWSIDDMLPHLDDRIVHRPLIRDVIQLVGDRETSASLVTSSEGDSVRSVVEAVLKIDAILEIQQKVMAGEIVPEY